MNRRRFMLGLGAVGFSVLTYGAYKFGFGAVA